MTNMQISGIFLAVVMLCGSIPLGYSEPLRVQLESGLEIDQIQCDDSSHVLVLRTNGKLACVSERSAEKMEWEIISSIQKIVYDYPLNANSFENEQFGSEPLTLFGTVELSISKLPKVGETATLTYTYTQTSEHQPYDPYLYHGISLFEPFSFVNQTDVEFVAADPEIYYDRDFEGIVKPVEHMNVNDTMTWIVEFTAVDEGQGTIRAGNADARTGYSMFVGEEETLLYDDYIALYGEPVRIQRSEQLTENEKLWELHLEALEDGENSTVRACYDVPRNERLELYEALNLTEAEIQKEFENCAAQHLATQSLSFLPKAFAASSYTVSGRVTMDDISLSPTTDRSLHDIRVCAIEYDRVARHFERPGTCANTSSSGHYRLTGIDLQSGSQDNTIDLLIIYSTDGRHSSVAGTNDIPYTRLDPLKRISSNVMMDRLITTDLNNADRDNAFWIADAIADAQDEVKDILGKRISKVNVGYQFDRGTESFVNPNNSGGGAYYCVDTSFNCLRDNTIFLDGFDDDSDINDIRSDDAIERWTVIHEYAHHVIADIYNADEPSEYPETCAHTFDGFHDESCMFNEGFADALPHLVDDSPTYDRNDEIEIFIEENYYVSSRGTSWPFPTQENNIDETWA